MEQRKSIKLSALLFLFGFRLLFSLGFCALLWLALLTYLQTSGVIFPGHIANQQVIEVINTNEPLFLTNDNFLPDYVYLNANNEIIETNISNQKSKELINAYNNDDLDQQTDVKVYDDGSYVLLKWEFKKEFVNPILRKNISFEVLWWSTLIVACVLSCIFNVVYLKRKLSQNLIKFTNIADNITNQQLDFTIQPSGIYEFDQALNAMDIMKDTLKETLETNWKNQQQRNHEINALAHDLKTPLTVIGGYAQLLHEENLNEEQLSMIDSIISSNQQAKDYVFSLLDVTNGLSETKVMSDSVTFMHLLYSNVIDYAKANHISLVFDTQDSVQISIQQNLLLRALANIINNAIEYSKPNSSVYVTSFVNENYWVICIKDSGEGFSVQALKYGKQRFWKDDSSRTLKNHHGIGLYFANQVIENHNGIMELSNDKGGIVTIQLPYKKEKTFASN